MKNTTRLLSIVLCSIMLSCAEGKHIEIAGKKQFIEPYGWMNEDAMKNDSVVYKVNTGNVVWSIIGIETIIVPIALTGTALYEPVRKK